VVLSREHIIRRIADDDIEAAALLFQEIAFPIERRVARHFRIVNERVAALNCWSAPEQTAGFFTIGRVVQFQPDGIFLGGMSRIQRLSLATSRACWSRSTPKRFCSTTRVPSW